MTTEQSTVDPCRCEQYKSYLQDLGNIGTRHENTRRFYLGVVSALFVFLSLTGKDGPIHGPVFVLVGITGILLCIVWAAHMKSFGALYGAKFSVLRMMEDQQGLFHAFDEEYKLLRANPRYKFLTFLDSITPALFAVLFIALLFFK